MKDYQYILLDFDGCLAKTLDLWLVVYKKIFSEYGLNLDDRTIATKAFGSLKVASEMGVDVDDGKFNDKLVNEVDSQYPNVKLYSNVFETLTKIKALGKKMALLTSSREELINPALKNLGIFDMFDSIICSEDVTKHKPDPEIIDKALELLHGSKDQAIIIGDSKSDLGAATNAGIDAVLFYPKENEKFYDLDFLKTFNPTFIVRDFKEILDIIS